MPEKRFPLWRPAQDPELFALYETKMLEPGWAGDLSDDQAHYIKDILTGRRKTRRVRNLRRLRRTWGVESREESVTDEAIRKVARNGIPDDPDYNARLVDEAGEHGPIALTA